MSKRKVKVEMSDDQDNKVTITFEGSLDEKSLKTLIVSANNILGKGTGSFVGSEDIPIEDALDLPLYDRVKLLISTAYGMGSWFTTNELCDSFQDVFTIQLKTTTGSTYLARLYEEGFLERSGSRNERKYKLKREIREKIPKLITQ
ncbi:MAG TPA: hypothetical protein VMX55_15150 [candidate division Zixibacteria bacterium]|nr:hypothetical protein [candidate division Zixibacteria bacterium]